jgi:hypothetical protein
MEQELTNETKHVIYHENPAHFWFLILFPLTYTHIQFTHDIFCHNELRFCKNRPVTLITCLTNPALNQSNLLSVNYENRRLSNCHGRNMSPESLYNNCDSKVPLVPWLSRMHTNAYADYICVYMEDRHVSTTAPRRIDMNTSLQMFMLRFSTAVMLKGDYLMLTLIVPRFLIVSRIWK